jgi:DNA-binding NtrC family response regulator
MRRRFLNDRLECPQAFSGIVTNNKAMRSIFQYIEAVAKSTQPILITGESGVGKELVARAVHTLSRGEGPLVSVNVAGLDDSVFTDTLFGHRKGAFTGADETRSGMVEQAAEGTLFLDEIGDLSLSCQVKLLRLLQEGEYYPLGSDLPRQLRARIVVATHQDLAEKRNAGGFRKDLFYRLRAHHVHIPPLRERRDDIGPLLDHFLEEAARSFGKKVPSYPKELITLLGTYSFPGNLRELRSMVFDAMSVHSSRMLSMNTFLLAMEVQGEGAALAAGADRNNVYASWAEIPTLGEAVEQLVGEAMRRSDNNQTIASRLLGISQPALSKRLKLQRRD